MLAKIKVLYDFTEIFRILGSKCVPKTRKLSTKNNHLEIHVEQAWKKPVFVRFFWNFLQFNLRVS